MIICWNSFFQQHFLVVAFILSSISFVALNARVHGSSIHPPLLQLLALMTTTCVTYRSQIYLSFSLNISSGLGFCEHNSKRIGCHYEATWLTLSVRGDKAWEAFDDSSFMGKRLFPLMRCWIIHMARANIINIFRELLNRKINLNAFCFDEKWESVSPWQKRNK